PLAGTSNASACAARPCHPGADRTGSPGRTCGRNGSGDAGTRCALVASCSADSLTDQHLRISGGGQPRCIASMEQSTSRRTQPDLGAYPPPEYSRPGQRLAGLLLWRLDHYSHPPPPLFPTSRNASEILEPADRQPGKHTQLEEGDQERLD